MDARMDPWCIVELWSGERILFGFVTQHPVTGGLAWTRSSPIIELDQTGGAATTQSGQGYKLGCFLKASSLPSLGLEAWLAYDVLIGGRAADGEAVPPVSADPGREKLWLASCKIARHLKVPVPAFAPRETEDFLELHAVAYMVLRGGGTCDE
ncbi:MAG: hypothetical protein ACRYGM_06055 [Janthinobacterium lividum]